MINQSSQLVSVDEADLASLLQSESNLSPRGNCSMSAQDERLRIDPAELVE